LTDAEIAEPLAISLEEVVVSPNRAYRRASPKALLSAEGASVLYENSRSLAKFPGVDRTPSHSEFHFMNRDDLMPEANGMRNSV